MLDAVSSQSFRLASGQMSPAGGSLGLPDEPRSCGGFATGPFCAGSYFFTLYPGLAPLWRGVFLSGRFRNAEWPVPASTHARAPASFSLVARGRRVYAARGHLTTVNVVSPPQSSLRWRCQKQRRKKRAIVSPRKTTNKRPQAGKAQSTPAGLTSYPHCCHLTHGSATLQWRYHGPPAPAGD